MKQKTRVLGAKLARELSEAEQAMVAGGGGGIGDKCGGLCTTPGSDDYHL